MYWRSEKFVDWTAFFAALKLLVADYDRWIQFRSLMLHRFVDRLHPITNASQQKTHTHHTSPLILAHIAHCNVQCVRVRHTATRRRVNDSAKGRFLLFHWWHSLRSAHNTTIFAKLAIEHAPVLFNLFEQIAHNPFNRHYFSTFLLFFWWRWSPVGRMCACVMRWEWNLSYHPTARA